MKIVKFLIILLLLIFPFGEILRLNVSQHLAVKPLDIIAGLVVLVWIAVKVYRKEKIKNEFLKLLLPFPAIGLLALSLNTSWLKPDELMISFLYLLRWVVYACIFLVVTEMDKGFKKKIFTILIVDAYLLTIFGFIQYLYYSELKNLYYLGWDDHMYRLFSTLLDPNFAGAFYVLILILTGGLLYTRWVEKSRKFLYPLILLFILAFVALFLTFSRSALLMLICAAVTFLVLIKQKKLIFFLILLLFAFTIVISSKFYVESLNLFRIHSSQARLNDYSEAVKIIADRPLLGVGFNSYRYAKKAYHFNTDWVKYPSHADAGVDNSFLFILATTGIVGLAAYLYMLVAILRKGLLAFRKNKHIMGAVLVASLMGLVVDAQFINSLFYSHIMLWIWLLVALTPSTSSGSRESKLP